MTKEALELSLEALTYIYTETTADEDELIDQAITAIKEALAQTEPDPVAWMIWGKNNVPSLTFKKPSDKYVFDSLYITPPQRKPLTNDAARKLWSHIEGVTVSEAVMFLSVVRATEAAHGIKE